MAVIYKQLSCLVHSDKQSKEWIEKGTEAQKSKWWMKIRSSQTNCNTVLNIAQKKYAISVTPNEVVEKSTLKHKIHWNTTLF